MTTDRERMAQRQDGGYKVPIMEEPPVKRPVPKWIEPKKLGS